MSDTSNDNAFVIGLFCGALVGAAVAALFIPRSGPETREQVVERGLELKGRAEDVIGRAQQVADQTISRVQTSAQQLLSGESAPKESGGSGI